MASVSSGIAAEEAKCKRAGNQHEGEEDPEAERFGRRLYQASIQPQVAGNLAIPSSRRKWVYLSGGNPRTCALGSTTAILE